MGRLDALVQLSDELAKLDVQLQIAVYFLFEIDFFFFKHSYYFFILNFFLSR